MAEFVEQSPEERRLVFEEASDRLGLPAVSIEKDFWVCWTLGVLFGLEGMGEALVFKGGTSLSKAWKLVERFSEDIDIVIDRERLGFGGDEGPEKGVSGKQRKKRMERLKGACLEFVSQEIEPVLRATLKGRLTDSFGLTADSQDGMTLLFRYPSVYEEGAASYLRREVKIEMGARSDSWPAETVPVVPYVAEVLPEYFEDDASVNVRTISAERTCLDKMLLLHEENFRPKDRAKKERMSRHYYDLYRLIVAGIGERSASDSALLARVVEHRSFFFAYSWIKYDEFGLSDLRLLPKEDFVAFWREDYRKMRAEMFFGSPPSFEEVLTVVDAFEKKLRSDGEG